MNARDNTIETLKALLTTGSLRTHLGESSLLRICEVQHYPPSNIRGLQNLSKPTRSASVSFPVATVDEVRVPGLEILMDQPSHPAKPTQVVIVTIDSDSEEPRQCEKRPRDQRVHLPKTKKAPRVDLAAKTSAPRADLATKPSASRVDLAAKPSAPVDPFLYCAVCRWRYPNTYSGAEKQRHRDLALKSDCQRDVGEYRQRQREIKKMQQRLEREDLMNGEDLDLKAKYGSIRTCPHCDESLEGRWGQFKKDHIESCSAKILDKELSKIVGESALIPKKSHEPPQPDRFAITFTSLLRKSRIGGTRA